MESSRASLDTDWFCCSTPGAGTAYNDDGDDPDEDDDDDGHNEKATDEHGGDGEHDQRAQAIADALHCIDACTLWIAASRTDDQPMPTCREVAKNCTQLWRSKFKRWQVPCGNQLNVPDLLFVAACHLRVVAMPSEHRMFAGSMHATSDLAARIQKALKEWNQAPSVLHTSAHTTIDACARAIVFWGSCVAPAKTLQTALSLEDVSMLTMNVNVHQNLDNRARNTDLKPTGSSAEKINDNLESATTTTTQAAGVVEETLLQSFVPLASRFAFFASLHMAAQQPCTNPQLETHRRVAAICIRPPTHEIASNVVRMTALFAERSKVSMPEIMQRAVNYTIWKSMLSVGSMEVGRLCVSASCGHRRTFAWLQQ
jgi:hypothetical protein